MDDGSSEALLATLPRLGHPSTNPKARHCRRASPCQAWGLLVTRLAHFPPQERSPGGGRKEHLAPRDNNPTSKEFQERSFHERSSRKGLAREGSNTVASGKEAGGGSGKEARGACREGATNAREGRPWGFLSPSPMGCVSSSAANGPLDGPGTPLCPHRSPLTPHPSHLPNRPPLTTNSPPSSLQPSLRTPRPSRMRLWPLCL